MSCWLLVVAVQISRMDNAMDPELASEMVKLLAQELKVVRTQLREAERRIFSSPSVVDSTGLTRERVQGLIAENESLKADNAALQANVSRLQDELAQTPPIKAEEDSSYALQYEESMHRMREELAGVLAENEELINEKVKRQGYKNSCQPVREKYKRSKAEKGECQEVVEELRVELLKCTQELEQLSRKAAVTDIDFRTFFEDALYSPVEEQPELESIQPYTRNVMRQDFPRISSSMWRSYGLPAGSYQVLSSSQLFQYNPKNNGGTWTKLNDTISMLVNGWTICYLVDKAWHYLGTYERTGDCMTIGNRNFTAPGSKKLQYASQRTTLFQDLVPPSQTRMVENMYTTGVIKLQCFGIRCVGFDQDFSEELLELSFPTEQADRQLWHPYFTGCQHEGQTKGRVDWSSH
ncbi:hypothetical protein BU15DRAFT_61245 [Melanogaster broomeanus]|nr:hypothetical protein BU15DRAFT_61245 [Melanogaster broomeanus]